VEGTEADRRCFRVTDNPSRTLSRAALVLAKGLSRVDPQDLPAGN
jgi:hypothetical protein